MRIAVVQTNPIFGQVRKNVENALSLMDTAAADLYVLPELFSTGYNFIDESEVLTPADENYHLWKHDFKISFVCGCRDLGEALRRVGEGAAMIRTKGEARTGNIVEAVRHIRTVQDAIRKLITNKFISN